MSKILVVDDEAIITMQLEERLHAMGYTVVGMAASGEDAIEKAPPAFSGSDPYGYCHARKAERD